MNQEISRKDFLRRLFPFNVTSRQIVLTVRLMFWALLLVVLVSLFRGFTLAGFLLLSATAIGLVILIGLVTLLIAWVGAQLERTPLWVRASARATGELLHMVFIGMIAIFGYRSYESGGDVSGYILGLIVWLIGRFQQLKSNEG